MTDRDGALLAHLDAVAGGLAGIERRAGAGTVEYLRLATVFAAASDGTAEFRLGREIARAAALTTGAGASSRGADWVRFTPGSLDRYALDRAAAWFESAWRRTVGGRDSTAR